MAAVSTEILLHGHYQGEINNVNGCWSDWPSNLKTLKAAVPKGGRPWQFYFHIGNFARISSNSALAFCYFFFKKVPVFIRFSFCQSFSLPVPEQRKSCTTIKKTGSLWLPVVLVFYSEILLKLFKFPVVKGRLFFGHFFCKAWVINVLKVLNKHFFEWLFAGFSSKCGHGSKV